MKIIEEADRTRKWNFRYYGNEMFKWHKWQWAIFTSLNKLRIYSALIYSMSYFEFNFFKKKKLCEGIRFSPLVLQERICPTKKLPKEETDYFDGKGTINPLGFPAEEWEQFSFAPNKINPYRSSVKALG